jgi:hypothetical protein
MVVHHVDELPADVIASFRDGGRQGAAAYGEGRALSLDAAVALALEQQPRGAS